MDELSPGAPPAGANEERLSPAEEARVSAAIQLSEEQAQENASTEQPPVESDEDRLARDIGDAAAEQSPQSELAYLIEERDRYAQRMAVKLAADHEDFHPYVDCDRILAAGTPVVISGVECRLLTDCPVLAPEFRDEAVFAEHLSQVGGLGANASGLRRRYNGNGALLGLNEEHPLNKLDARIAELEAAAESEKAE
jgi:hypothetical protein